MTTRPYLGYGLGLRKEHYETVLDERPAVDWFEILSENYMVAGGKPLYYLDRIREHYPMVMHGVSLSIGSIDPLDREYLRQLKALAGRVEPAWISDHLCWTGVNSTNLHDLMPLPYTPEAIRHVAERVSQVQDYLGRQILLEPGDLLRRYSKRPGPVRAFLGHTEIGAEIEKIVLDSRKRVVVVALDM